MMSPGLKKNICVFEKKVHRLNTKKNKSESNFFSIEIYIKARFVCIVHIFSKYIHSFIIILTLDFFLLIN